MSITAHEALWFLPFVLPVCLYVCFTDLREMRITNQAVLVLGAIFVLVGPFVLPLPEYGWRLVHMVVVLVVGFLLNAGGAIGAGDAKFAAAAAPYVALGDLRILLAIFAANLLAAFFTHRLAKYCGASRRTGKAGTWGGSFPWVCRWAGR